MITGLGMFRSYDEIMRRKRVYISGKMSGLAKEVYMARFMAAERALKEAGLKVCNPARFVFSRWEWLYRLLGYHMCLCMDLWMLSRCDAIYMIGNDWMNSKGAVTERRYAMTFGKKCIYETEKDGIKLYLHEK